MAVRQNNVLWFGLAFVLTWVQIVRNVVEDASTDVPQEVHALGSIAAQKSLRREFVIHAAGPFSSFLLGFLAFGTFLAWNGGQIALADQDAHPPFTFHAGNVWAVAFTECFLFLPLAVALFGRIVHWSRENSGRVLLGGCVLSSLYLITFRNTHPYNFLPWWLHNKVVLLATSSLGWELVFLVPVLCQSLVFVCTPFWRTELYLLYPVAIVYLAASWLIEPRYFFIPLMLFALFRKPGHQSVEWALAAWNVLGGIALFWGVCHGLWLP
jgi:alpha-1,2-glucosyltransferase